jgi:hypothetical protein
MRTGTASSEAAPGLCAAPSAFWAAGTLGSVVLSSTGTSLPAVITAPQITGTAQVGSTLTLSTGTWTNTPTSYTRTWRNGATQLAGNVSTYALTTADIGRTITGDVVATNASGSTLATSNSVGPVVAAGDPTGLPLLYEANVTGPGRYAGAFVPPTGADRPFNFDNGGYTVSYNPTGNGGAGSLIIEGRQVNASLLTEVAIPSTLNTNGVYSSMPQAPFLVPAPHFYNIAGTYFSSGISGNPTASGGVFVHGGSIYQTGEVWYDAAGVTVETIFKHSSLSLNLGSSSGPFAFQRKAIGAYSTGYRWYSGQMGNIPAEWQSLFGGPCLISDKQYSINPGQSLGPFAAVFDPADVGVTSPIPNTVVVGYPIAQPLDPNSYSGGIPVTGYVSPIFSVPDSSRVTGVVFPSGTRSVLFFGLRGKGPITYSSAGYAAEPRVFCCWAYDALDLLAVKNGTMLAYQLQPYAHWDITDPPGVLSTQDHQCCYTWDDANRRLFMVESGRQRAGSFQPPIHVYNVSF